MICARFFVRSFTYSEVFRPEEKCSFGTETVSWRCLSMPIGGRVEGISFEASVLSLACLISSYCLSLSWSWRIYICLKFKEVWTDLEYLYFCSIQEQLEMRLLTRFFRSFGNSGLHGDEAPEEQTTIQKF